MSSWFGSWLLCMAMIGYFFRADFIKLFAWPERFDLDATRPMFCWIWQSGTQVWRNMFTFTVVYIESGRFSASKFKLWIFYHFAFSIFLRIYLMCKCQVVDFVIAKRKCSAKSNWLHHWCKTEELWLIFTTNFHKRYVINKKKQLPGTLTTKPYCIDVNFFKAILVNPLIFFLLIHQNVVWNGAFFYMQMNNGGKKSIKNFMLISALNDLTII